MNWIELTEDTLPQPKTKERDGNFLQEASTEIICFDGTTKWTEFYGFDDTEDKQWWFDNVTHYIRIDEIPTP